MKSIGVVIPCRNSEAFLPDAFDSIMKNLDGFLHVSAVIVDDGSDEPFDFAWHGLKMAVLRLPESRGIGIARNVGAASLNTDYFLFLDADDWLHPGAIKNLYDLLQERPHAAFAYGNYTEGGNLIPTLKWSEGRGLLDQQNIASYCQLWERRAFWNLGGYSDIHVAEDWELQKRAAQHLMIGAHSDATIFEHRLHDKNKWAADSAFYGGMKGVAQLVTNYGR